MLFVFVICMLARRFLRAFVLLVELLRVFFVLLDFRLSPFVNFFFLFFDFVFLEDGAAGSGCGRNFLANQILLGFNDAGGKQFGFFFADVHFRSGFRFARFAAQRSFLVLIRLRGCRATHFIRKIFGDGLIRFRCFDAFGGSAGEKPTGQSATRTARSVCRSRLAGNARLRLVRFYLRFEAFRFHERSSCRCFRHWPPAILRERFARQYKRFFRGIGWRGRTRSVGTAIVDVTQRATVVAAATIRIAATASAISTTIRATVTAAKLAFCRGVLGWSKITCTSALSETTATATAASAATTASKSAPSAASTKLWSVAATSAVAASAAPAFTLAARAVTWRRAILGRAVAWST